MTTQHTTYLDRALAGELAELRDAKSGRNNTLFHVAARMYQFCEAGAWSHDEMSDILANEASLIGLKRDEIRATLRSAQRQASGHPAELPSGTGSATAIARVIAPPAECNAPTAAWQARTERIVAWAEGKMTDQRMKYLLGRGLTEETIIRARLGYNDEGRWSERADWGLEPDGENTRMWIPQGYVIPWYVGGYIWKLQIRREVAKPDQERYKTIPGSSNALYGVDSLRDGEPAMLVEGPFDALAVSQVAGDVLGVAACGTSGARRARWYSALALCSPVLVALDADPAGDSASQVWCDILQDGKRHRPHYADPSQMLQDGADVRGWVLAGLGRTEPQALTFMGIPLDYWREEVALGCAASLARLKAMCEVRECDYEKTIAHLKGE
jgi:Toprim domain-containing protein